MADHKAELVSELDRLIDRARSLRPLLEAAELDEHDVRLKQLVNDLT